ncbi:MAG: hypothetical protein LBS70_05585, partial [Candidatus Accumulibacter sp.]|nr:hypothetical protein [Accumulibacter sp.]
MMRSHKARIGLAALAALAMGLAGCESAPVRQTSAEPTYQEASMSQFIAANYRAADALAAPAAPGVAANNFRSSGTMLVATIADINALEQSTPLGRLITEHLSSRLSQTGNAV